MASEEVGKFLATQKVERALGAAEERAPDVEYFVDAAAVDMVADAGQVSCLVEADDGDRATIVLADGQFTGTTFTVPSSSVTAAEAGYLEQGARDLFSSGVKHVD
jgi:hypothetical protein